jgi:hypothetical protein
MNEASVLSPFMKKLRKRMPGAVIVKHRDSSMIGLPDFSITFRGHVIWLEAKLYNMPKRFSYDWSIFLKKAQEGSPTQAAMMGRLAKASASLYLIWIKKTCLLVFEPISGQCKQVKNSSEGVELIYDILNQWDSPPFPGL